MQPKIGANRIRLKKLTWSTIVQLKLAHGYFRSYLIRTPSYDSETCPNCDSDQKETPYHMLLECQGQSEARKRTIYKLDKGDQNLRSLFLTKSGQNHLINFLTETKVATRKWLLRLI